MEAAKEAVLSVAPAGETIEWSGQSREENNSSSSTMKTLAMALSSAWQLSMKAGQSRLPYSLPYRRVFSERSSLNMPSIKMAALLGSTSDGFQNSVYMQIGIIMIIGLAAKNAILIVEFAKERVDNGMDPLEAAVEASRLRFRPILMTAFTSIIGCLPLALATGAGAGARCGMGIAVVGGMTFATLFGLFLIPAFYIVTEKAAAAIRSSKLGGGIKPYFKKQN